MSTTLRSCSLLITASIASFAFACSDGAGESNFEGKSGAGETGSSKDDRSTVSLVEAGESEDGGCAPALVGIVRDFQDTHPDFERQIDFDGRDPGIVAALLGVDHKPVYGPATNTATTGGKALFDEWYRDVPGVNIPIQFTVPLVQGPNGIATYSNSNFFPIDNQGFGNQGRAHNYHFTFELHTTFVYKGGEVFTFTGDDDLFAFVDGHLALDLGGLHQPLTDTINLDAFAATNGLVKGKTYPLDVFQAERKTVLSNFRIDTSLEFNNCNPILL